MQNLIKNVSLSDQITIDNPNKVSWGPDNFLAIASENIVNIYQYQENKLQFFRKITKHKAKITAISWNIPTVEIYKPNSFDILLAVGDEEGNCLIYEIFSLSRRGGISPDSVIFPINDIKWKLDDPSTLFILTAQPSLLSISVGTPESLSRSKMKTISINGSVYQSINISIMWIQNVEYEFNRISIDLFNSNRILVVSPQTYKYFAIKIGNKSGFTQSKSNTKNAVSAVLRFPIENGEKLLHVEYFPFRPNCLLLLTDENLYFYDLFSNLFSSIFEYNHLKPFCICCGIFSHLISDRFWLATTDGTVYRMTIAESEDADRWAIDCVASSPKQQNLLGLFSDRLDPTRICVVYSDGIGVIRELPSRTKDSKSGKTDHKKIMAAASADIARSYSQGSGCIISENPSFSDIFCQWSNAGIIQSCSQCLTQIERENLYEILNHDNSTELSQFDSSEKLAAEGQIINHKLFMTAFLPCLTCNLVSWAADKGRIALLSSCGNVTILAPKESAEGADHAFNYLNIDELECFRYKVSDTRASQIAFYKDDSVVLNGSKLHILNYKHQGEIKELPKKVTRFCIKDDILGFTPTSSSFELYTINNSSFTKSFASGIKMFCPCYDDKNKWAIVLNSPQNTLCIIGYIVSKRYEIDENIFGSIVSVAFASENIFLATSKSIIHKFNIKTGESKSVIYSSVSMRSISIYKNYIIACDMSYNCKVLSTEDLSFVSLPSSQCIGKEIQILTDDFCVVQVKSSSSHPVLMLHKFPSLESVRPSLTNNVNLKHSFLNCSRISEFIDVTKKIGDLPFLQFLQIAKHEKNTILPSVYCITRNKVIENERCIAACNAKNARFTDEYIEYLILSGQSERAAKFALSSVNKQNILLAHACLSPSSSAVKKIIEYIPSIKGSEKVFALLFKLADDTEEAAKIAAMIPNSLAAIKFLKLICSKDEIKKFIMMAKAYKDNYSSMAFVDDYQKALTVLLNMNEISKAFVYMKLIEENLNSFAMSQNENEINNQFFFDNLRVHLIDEWNKIKKDCLFV